MPTYQPFIERTARVTVEVTRPNAQGAMTTFGYVFQENRMRIQVRQGGNQFGNAHVNIYGVPLADMNQIARLWLEAMAPQNADTLNIDVWDGKVFVPFFQGVISWSSVDASAMPDVKLVIDANAAMPLGNAPASPYANPGPVSTEDVLKAVVEPAGFAVDYSPTAQLLDVQNVRLTGSPLQQVGQFMRGFPALTWFVNLQRLVVRQADAPFTDDPVRIAVDTGLMAAPVYSTSGLQFSTVFNPQLRPGIALNVQTSFDFVNRTKWVAAVLSHDLAPNWPGGPWTTSCAANSYGAKTQ